MKSFRKLKYRLILLALSLVSFTANAQSSAGNQGGSRAGSSPTGKINNPLKNINNLPDFVEQALRAIVQVAAPVVVLLIIWTGFQFVWAQGNKEKLGDAKKSLLYTLIGAALLLGAWTLATIIKTTVEQLG